MTFPSLKFFSAAALAVGLSLAAKAAPINITVASNGTLLNGVGVANAAQYGALVPPPTSNDAGDNLAFLVAEQGFWNATHNPDLPTPTDPTTEFNLTGTSYTALAGYEYVVLHFGAGAAGGHGVSPGGWWEAFYLGGEGGYLFSVPTVGGKSVGGFSSARYYNPVKHNVPDGGASIVLLGLGVGAVAFVSRKRKAA